MLRTPAISAIKNNFIAEYLPPIKAFNENKVLWSFVGKVRVYVLAIPMFFIPLS
jgi:hypothetical protein